MSTTEEKILIGVSRLRNLMHRAMERHFRENGLTSAQFSVLEALYSKGELKVTEIQEAILGTPGNVPVIINNLAKAGYVSKKQDAEDKRVSFISLTDSGRELIERIYPEQHQIWLEEILSPCSKEEKEKLSKLLIQSYNKVKRMNI